MEWHLVKQRDNFTLYLLTCSASSVQGFNLLYATKHVMIYSHFYFDHLSMTMNHAPKTTLQQANLITHYQTIQYE